MFYLRFFKKYLNDITSSLEQASKTGSLDSNKSFRQYKPDLLARFMKIKSINPKLRQDQIAKDLSCSSSTLQRYRQGKEMSSPHRKPLNTHKGRQKISHTNRDLIHVVKMTSKDLNCPQKSPQKKMLNHLKIKTKIV